MTVTTQENTLNNLKSYIANYSKISLMNSKIKFGVIGLGHIGYQTCSVY